MSSKSPTAVKPRRFSDANIEALREFEMRGTFRDTGVVGLRLRVGVRRMSWFFFQEHRKHGTRSTTCKMLGHWPALNVADARKEALKIAGRIAADRIEPGKRSAAKFADAMDEYLAHLVRQSERRGKPARWAGIVSTLIMRCSGYLAPAGNAPEWLSLGRRHWSNLWTLMPICL
jgi:hypothetical protein